MPLEFGDARLPERFWRKVVIDGESGCWVWTGYRNEGGYGYFNVTHSKKALVHRHAYEVLTGPIPWRMQVDHVRALGCTSRACCNPRHLECVTPRENLRRATLFPPPLAAVHRAKTHCPQGHPYCGENLIVRYGRRYCRECNRDEKRRRRRERQHRRRAPA